MPKAPRRDTPAHRLATPHDEDGVIRNDRPAGVYLPREAGRRERLLDALRRAAALSVKGGNT